MVDLGFSLQAQYDLSFSQAIVLLNNAGFSAVSPIWSPDLALETLATCVQKHNMTIQSLHAPHGGLAYLWNSKDPLSVQAQRNITDCIDACAQFQIPITVVHGWQGLIYTFPKEPLDFSVFDRIVDHADQKKVSIAFENLEGEEYLDALMAHFAGNDTVGFCWDSGHEMCYNHSQDLLAKYGDRLLCTHLNDNLGIKAYDGTITWLDDLHLLPFDGIADWTYNAKRLAKCNFRDVLTFELTVKSKPGRHDNDAYGQMPFERYVAEAYKRACRFGAMVLAEENL